MNIQLITRMSKNCVRVENGTFYASEDFCILYGDAIADGKRWTFESPQMPIDAYCAEVRHAYEWSWLTQINPYLTFPSP